MRRMNFEIDTNEHDLFITLELPKYQFRAICSSDNCRLDSKNSKDRTDTGAVKDVLKKVTWCPSCGDALFWEKIKVA